MRDRDPARGSEFEPPIPLDTSLRRASPVYSSRVQSSTFGQDPAKMPYSWLALSRECGHSRKNRRKLAPYRPVTVGSTRTTRSHEDFTYRDLGEREDLEPLDGPHATTESVLLIRRRDSPHGRERQVLRELLNTGLAFVHRGILHCTTDASSSHAQAVTAPGIDELDI